jgi:DNA-binding NtrC family response regulator
MDIPLLVQELLKKLSASQTGRRTKTPWSISSEALDRMLTYSWPGNVRELENCLERALALSSGPLIGISDLPSPLQSPPSVLASALPDSVVPLEEMERQAIERALSNTGGDKLLAARLLGIGKTTLYRKLLKYQKN